MSLPFVALPPWPDSAADPADRDLAEKHRPMLMLDSSEPALPLAFGYSVLRAAATSPSSKFAIVPPPGGAVIEYAIWYDWDIQHLYDLEHVWVHVDADGAVVRVEGSMHGLRVSMDAGTGLPEMHGPRPVLYVEPGKHAIWAVSRAMDFIAGDRIRAMCGPDAGAEGVHLGNRFADSGAYAATPRDHRLARLAMKRAAFVPRFDFTLCSDESPISLLTWADLATWIPERVQVLVAAMPSQVPHLAAVFLDCGDTLINETTEIKVGDTELVLEAEEIPFAMDAVRMLHQAGYRLSLVADGLVESFQNLLEPRGIWPLMEAHVISEEVGALKPSPKMFSTAMTALGLPDTARSRIVMVGNNLERDIAGANAFGLVSLFVAWSQQRSHTPSTELENWDHRIDSLDKLVPMIEAIELALPEVGGANG